MPSSSDNRLLDRITIENNYHNHNGYYSGLWQDAQLFVLETKKDPLLTKQKVLILLAWNPA